MRPVFLLACGCFNPPTIMHLRMFEMGRDALQASGDRPHKVLGGILSPVHDKYEKQDLASGSDRLSMVRNALQDNSWVRASSWELGQAGWSRTRLVLDTHKAALQSFCSGAGDRPEWVPPGLDKDDLGEAVFYLLCGSDVQSFLVPGLWSPEDIQTIVGSYGLVVISRSDENADDIIRNSDVLSRHKKNIFLVASSMGNDISSTKIRQQLRLGLSVKYLVHGEVEKYVRENKLYSQSLNGVES